MSGHRVGIDGILRNQVVGVGEIMKDITGRGREFQGQVKFCSRNLQGRTLFRLLTIANI